ncbi:ribosome maturation factor RimP [Mycobacterium uberis]|uniref:Ribosome maturation factor RimP n=1 Tax=Mycobacterium uberis TaxID=2162698 RepID=A0A3E1HG40_9MYCO|nr:ribosome maturation factor RimP [Mycobacterium uberis]RFD25387.1 ribosome maturation factor RimP [Mycobacterium uberis]
MSTGLLSQTQVIELLGREFARASYEIEDLVIDTRSQPPWITVIAYSYTTFDLDTIATLSRSVSTLLDGLDSIVDRYVFGVSSLSVERLLNSKKHFRRTCGHEVELALSNRAQLTGRVGQTCDDTVVLVVRDDRDRVVRAILLVEIMEVVVQEECSPYTPVELELATGVIRGQARRTEAGT